MSKFNQLVSEGKSHIGYIIVTLTVLILSGVYAIVQNDILSFILFLYLIFDSFYKINVHFSNQLKVKKHIETLGCRVKKAGDKVFEELPIGILLYDEYQVISWVNPYVRKIFKDELFERSLEDVNAKLFKEIIKGSKSFELKLDENTYRFIHEPEERLLYFTDYTEYATLKETHIKNQVVVGMLVMDNYEEVIHHLNEQEKSELYGKVISIIMQWADRHKILIRSTANDRFVLMFTNEVLQELKDQKFSITDKVREASDDKKTTLTISIGVATGYDDFAELGQNANYMLDLALSRGGDQVAIKTKNEDKFLFYGGKTNPMEKRNRVRARVNAQSYERLVRESDRVIIMGHRFPDVDAIGASIGLLRMGSATKKEAYIVLNRKELDKTAESFVVAIDEDEFLGAHFISAEEAIEMMTRNTLLVVADTQDPKLVIEPQLLTKAKKIAVFDHHRRGIETIESVLSFTEPYASSTVELVVDMFDYYSQKVKLTQLEASIMLAGIIVDTRRFSYHTGRRTYETAAILKQHGAEESLVQELLRAPIENYYSKAHLIERSEVFNNHFIIAPADSDLVLEKVQIAQAADDLLNIQNIKASFVISKINETAIGISARSLGDINVQIIMEHLGGGGHLNTAATQLNHVTIDQAVVMLKEAILNELEESGDE